MTKKWSDGIYYVICGDYLHENCFHPINMKFGHGIPRVLRYSAMTFLSRASCSSDFIRDSLDPYRQKTVSAYL